MPFLLPRNVGISFPSFNTSTSCVSKCEIAMKSRMWCYEELLQVKKFTQNIKNFCLDNSVSGFDSTQSSKSLQRVIIPVGTGTT